MLRLTAVFMTPSGAASAYDVLAPQRIFPQIWRAKTPRLRQTARASTLRPNSGTPPSPAFIPTPAPRFGGGCAGQKLPLDYLIG